MCACEPTWTCPSHRDGGRWFQDTQRFRDYTVEDNPRQDAYDDRQQRPEDVKA